MSLAKHARGAAPHCPDCGTEAVWGCVGGLAAWVCPMARPKFGPCSHFAAVVADKPGAPSHVFTLLTGDVTCATKLIEVQDVPLSWETLRTLNIAARRTATKHDIVCLMSPKRMAELADLYDPQGYVRSRQTAAIMPGSDPRAPLYVLPFDGCTYVEDAEQRDSALLFLDLRVSLSRTEAQKPGEAQTTGDPTFAA